MQKQKRHHPGHPGHTSGPEPGLAEKLQGSHSAPTESLQPRFPRLLSRIARMLLQPTFGKEAMGELASNSASGPVMQGLLRAVQYDG